MPRLRGARVFQIMVRSINPKGEYSYMLISKYIKPITLQNKNETRTIGIMLQIP